MKSRYSLNLGKPFGIKVSVHWTFSLLIAWIVIISINQGLGLTQILIHILFVLTLFACVVLHEFGHSLMALKLGGKVQSITLLPIGGIANITEMPEKAKDEFLVSLAGPMVNVVIALLLWLYTDIIQGIDLAGIEYDTITAVNFPVILMTANLFIVAFNLIPAFPLDGGRLFRSLLSLRMSRLKATGIAKDIGQLFAIFFIFAGLFFNPFLIIIGFFVLLGAKAEYEMVKYKDILKDYKVEDIVKTDNEVLDENDSLGNAAEKITHTYDRGFVITSGGEYAGILTKSDLIKGLNTHGKDGLIKDVMSRDIEGVSIKMPLFDAYKNIHQKRYDIVPVEDDGEFRGIIDLESINEFFIIQKAMS